jgi:hypothetical protein
MHPFRRRCISINLTSLWWRPQTWLWRPSHGGIIIPCGLQKIRPSLTTRAIGYPVCWNRTAIPQDSQPTYNLLHIAKIVSPSLLKARQNELYFQSIKVTLRSYYWNLGRYSDSLRDGRSRDRIAVGGEVFRTGSNRHRGPFSLLYKGYQVSLPGI